MSNDKLSVKERIGSEISVLKENSDAGKIEAFFCIRVERDEHGEIVPTLTVIAPDTATREQLNAFKDRLGDIAELLRAVNKRSEQ